MMVSYFKIALRYLAKNKIYSFINVAGLSLSLSCAMLMILYTKDELSFDTFHKDVNSIYLIAIDVRQPDGSSDWKMGVTGFLHGPRFKATVPEIQSYLRLSPSYKDIKLGDEVQSQKIILADTNFFSMFQFPLIHGNSKTALVQPNSVVISQDVAIKHFGTEDALNKIILIESEGQFKPYTVTGVAKRCPQNSSIQFEVLLPLAIPIEVEQKIDNWVDDNVNTFVRLSAGSNVATVNAKMQQVFESESKEVMNRVRSTGFTQSFHHQLQSFTDIHLSQEIIAEGSLINGSNPMYSYILSGIALFILIIACINFVNLTIARSVKRAREIGIRKVVGSGRQQLIGQFLGESFLLCCLSFISALFLAKLLLPFFNSVINKELSLSYLMDVRLIVSYLILLIVTGLLAGFYPAIVLSGYNPVQTLYNQFRLSGKNYLQRGLVIFQFALATFMILATITIYLQFDYLTTKQLGFDPDHIVGVPKRNLSLKESAVFRDELLKNPEIESVAPFGHDMTVLKLTGDRIYNPTYEIVDENFIDILKIPIVLGRNFSTQFPSDSIHSVLVNEAFVKMAGWTNPIGSEVNLFNTKEKKVVIGVVKDYHFQSLREIIGPQLFSAISNTDDHYQRWLVRIKPNSEASSLPFIEKTFKKLFPLTPYAYEFYDEKILQNYEAESKWKKVILLGASMTIFIAGIGLFGLSILTAERRFKEIGIRKVLGASVQYVALTLSKEFVQLISIALLIAMPIAYYACSSWLETYPYRTNVGPGTFILTGTLVVIIALATTSFQSIKTALSNPVESLRRD